MVLIARYCWLRICVSFFPMFAFNRFAKINLCVFYIMVQGLSTQILDLQFGIKMQSSNHTLQPHPSYSSRCLDHTSRWVYTCMSQTPEVQCTWRFVFTTTPKPKGIPPSACSGTSKQWWKLQSTEPLKCLRYSITLTCSLNVWNTRCVTIAKHGSTSVS